MTEIQEGSKYIINWCRWCGRAALKVRRTVQDGEGKTRRYAICPVCETSQPLTQMPLIDVLLHSTSPHLWPEFHNPEFRSLAHAQISDNETREVLQAIRRNAAGDVRSTLQAFVNRFRPDLVS